MLATLIFSAFLLLIIRYLFVRFKNKRPRAIAFLHPFSEAGGGGERVLWSCVAAIQDEHPEHVIYIITKHSKTTDSNIVDAAKNKFSLNLSSRNIIFVRLHWTKLIEASSYPILTLLLQCVGSMLLGLEVSLKLRTKTVVDTIGCSFAYPVLKFFGHKIYSYVHYPFISSDMIQRIRKGSSTYNNSKLIGKSRHLTDLKIFYYQILYKLYSWCGSCVEHAMVNSTWTMKHIEKAWPSSPISLLFPPCDTKKLVKLEGDRRPWILSLSQFRSEKNQELQIKCFAKLLEMNLQNKSAIRLIIAGGCRNDEDRERVEYLKNLCLHLRISEFVQFEVELSHDRIVSLLSSCKIGLHTMIDEHFGISIVEFMSSGLLTIANNSGGPKSDIIDDGINGWLASSEQEYAERLKEALELSEENTTLIQSNARDKCEIFSNEAFIRGFLEVVI